MDIIKAPFQVKEWLVQPSLNRISRGEKTILLEPKVMEVLLVLANHANEPVSREQLMETVWPGLVVSDDALTRCISALRSSLNDRHNNPEFIETIRKSGYRLIAPVYWNPDIEPATETQPQPGLSLHSSFSKWLIGFLAFTCLGLLAGNLFYQPSPSNSAARVVPFTSFQGNELEPAFSPDGKHVAFTWDEQTGTHFDIYVKSLFSEAPLRITSDSAYEVSPTWSPDGTRLAFARVWDTCEIMTASLFGGPIRKLAECGGWANPQIDWSPDSSEPQLAISESYARDEPHRIALLSLQTLQKHYLTNPSPTYRGDRLPRFSPDGKTIAFIRTTDHASEIYLVPAVGGTSHRLTFDNLEIAGLAWMPDGKSIMYSSNRTGLYSLWQISRDGGTPVPVLDNGVSIMNPAVAKQNGLMIYEQWFNERNIYRETIDHAQENAASALIASTHWDGEPSYSPDNNHIAFVSDRSGAFEIWLSESNGENALQLTNFKGPSTRHPQWSANGKRLTFDSRVEGNADIYIIDSIGASPRRLTSNNSIDIYPSWSPDGTWIYFTSNRSSNWQVWKVRVDGSQIHQVTQTGGFISKVDPEGKWLYFTKHDHRGLWRIAIDSVPTQDSAAIQIPIPVYRAAWDINQQGIYFVSPANDARSKLSFYNTDTGRTTDLKDLSIPQNQLDLTISPDSELFFYSQLDRSESNLILRHE